MPIIKGGITFKPGQENKEFVQKLEDAGVKIKLPFSATGFKATNIPKLADMTGVELANDKETNTVFKQDTEKKNKKIKKK